jgi:hypothetical protein
VKNMPQATNQSQGDRERILWVASRMYVTGEIDIAKLEEIESDCTEDFNNAMIVMSKRNLSHNLLDRIRKVWKSNVD